MAQITDCDAVYGPGPSQFHSTNIGGNPYPYGECTWYCWQYFHDVHQVNIPGNLGNGTDWTASAHRNNWTVDSSAGTDHIVCWSSARYPPFGHVAVCTQVDSGGGGFWVKEMNFTYFADKNSSLAGKIDCRHVTDLTGISGYILPSGVIPQGSSNDPAQNLLSSLEAPLTGIGQAIAKAGLYLEAEALTARSKALSLAQMQGGLAIMGGGGVLGGLTVLGGGKPTQGATIVLNRGREAVRKTRPAPVAPLRGKAASAWLPKPKK